MTTTNCNVTQLKYHYASQTTMRWRCETAMIERK